MTSMVEKVARALAESHYSDKEPDGMWQHMIPDARAALEAMQHHTKAMDAAGYDAYPASSTKTGIDHLDIYRSMINAALQEGKEGE